MIPQPARTSTAPAGANHPGRKENSFTRKIKENREAFRNYQQQILQGHYPGNNHPNQQMLANRHHHALNANKLRSQSTHNVVQNGARQNEFSTAGCSDI